MRNVIFFVSVESAKGLVRLQQSAKLQQILKQKAARPPVHNMKGHAALIEPSEFDWSEAELSREGRDNCAGIGVIARYKHDLPLPLQRWIRSKLCRRQMIEGLYESRSAKCPGYDLRRKQTT